MTEAGKQLDLFDALEAQEGFDLEFKKARDHLPGDLWETYSAFANTDGGTIYLGVSQKGDDIRAVGVSDSDRLLKDFWSTVNNRGKVSHCLVTNKDVTVIPMVHGGNTFPVIAILVPRASRRERPVYVGQDPFSGTYRRNHEGDYKCTRQEVERMFADRSDEPADHRILKGFGMADLDPLSLKQYRNRFASRYPDHAWLAEDDKGLLQKLGGGAGIGAPATRGSPSPVSSCSGSTRPSPTRMRYRASTWTTASTSRTTPTSGGRID